MIDNCRTGYFQFDARQDGLYFIVFPPKDGNRPVSIDDVLYYIDKKKINCDTVKLGQAVKAGCNTETEVKVSEEIVHPYAEFGDYRISADCMRAEAFFCRSRYAHNGRNRKRFTVFGH